MLVITTPIRYLFSLCKKSILLLDGSLLHAECFSFCFRYLVKKNAPGLKATKIENKIGLRMVQNGDILLNKVFVSDEDRLPGVNSFQDTSKVYYIYGFVR